MYKSLQKQVLFWCFFLSANLALAQWGPIRIEFDETDFPAASQNLVSTANPGPVVVGEYDVVVPGAACGAGTEYAAGQDGINDLMVTATLVTGPGLMWVKTEGDYSTVSSGSFASDYQVNLGESRPNDYAYIKYDFVFINGLQNNIEASDFNTRHTSTNGSSEGYEWTQVTLNGTSINEANIGNYQNTDYNDITMPTNADGSYVNGITMSEFLSGMAVGSVAPGGMVTPGWWAIDDFNTTIFDDVEMSGNPTAGNGGPDDNQTINGQSDFGLPAATLVSSVTYYFGLTDVAFDVDGDGFTHTNTLPQARVTYFDIGATCPAVAAVCPTIGALSDPADICAGETFDISATGLVAMDMVTNMEADFGINFVSFSGAAAPADPYTGGTSVGTIAFANLDAANTEANLTGAGGTLAAGTYNICAILDQTPADMTCRPSQCIELTVNAVPVGPGLTGTITFCEGETITPITAVAVPGGVAATFNFYADAALTTTSPGTISGADYTAALTGPGTEQVFITQTINGCESPATGVTITVNAAPAAPVVADITVCDGDDTTITPGAGGGGGPGGVMVLGTEGFDGGGVGFTSSDSFNDGTSDHFMATDGTTISNVSGPYSFQDGTNIFWAAEDIDDNGGLGINPGNVTLNPINITGASSVEVCIDMAAGNNNPPGSNGYDQNDHVYVQYSTDVNATLINGFCFNYLNNGNPSDISNEPLYSDPNCDGDVSDGVLMTVVGQTFCFTIPDAETSGAGAASLTVRVEVAMGSGNEEIAFDNITVSGVTAPMMAGTFNFYDANPNPGPANLLAGPAGSYDPGTTVATSPESVFVTTTNSFGCESEATEVVVTVNALPAAPTFSGTTTFCEGETITPITAMGDAGATFQFFADAALTMPAPGTVAGADYTSALVAAGTETVFITQTVMGCQGPATMVDIEVLAAPAAPTFSGTTTFCEGETITPITAMGDAGATFTFYGDAALTTAAPGTVNGADYTAALTGPGMETVFFTQTNAMGCESAATSATITVIANPDPPMVMDITVCEGGDTEIIPTAAGGGGGGLMTVYSETFDTAGEGIAGACGTMDPTSCATNVPPSNGQWTVTGDASGLTATSDFFNTFAGVLNAQDTDTEICFLSQPINISTLISADFSVLIAERGTHETTDFVDVTLIVDGTPMLIPNWMGLGDGTHTLIDDFNTTTVTATGITGSTLQIQICVMNNAGSEDIDIDDIMVSGLGAGGPLYNFYDANPNPGPANLLAGMANTFDPMTTVATSPESVFVTLIDPISGCESEAVEVVVTVNSNPVLNIVTTDVVGCPGDATGTATVTTSAGTAPFTFVYTTTNGSGDDGDGNGIQTMLTAGTYTVVATDANGCTATADFTINDAVDAEAPMIVCPPSPIEIDCGESTLTANTGIATATDVCSANPIISFVDDLVLDGCGGRTGTLTRTFSATDEAGNISTCEQIINIVDNTPPTFTAPGDITIECTDDPTDLAITGMPTNLMDNCLASGIQNVWINEFHYDNVSTDANEFIELAGTAGLNLTGFTIVFYNGSNGTNYGVFTLPGGIIPDEGNGFGAFSFLVPGIQNGAPDGFALVDPSGAVLEFISYEGTFTAVDGPAMGLTSTDIGVSETGGTTATSSLQKIGSGTIGSDFLWSGPTDPSSPGLLNVNQTVTPIVFPVPTFTGFVDATIGDPNCPNGSVITRTFTVTDACGNTATATQVITVEDSTAPITPAAPADLVVDCPQDIPEAPVLVASDACGGNIMSTVSSVIINRQCATRFTMVRTFTFDDGCGNTSSVTQNIDVTDPGVLTVEPLADHIVDCEVNVVPQEHLIQSTSPCGNPPTVTSVINGPFGELGCPGTFYNVVYTIADDCGRSVQTTQRYTIQNDGPEFVCPVDICVIECPADTDMIQAQFDSYAELATVISSCSENAEMDITNNFSPNNFIPNNCGNGPIAYAGTKEYQIVTFQATDPCGRSTSCTALVVVVDNEAPVFQGTPTIGIAECDDRSQVEYDAFIQSRFDMLNATDACSDDATLTYSYTPDVPNFICGANGYAITEVFLTVTDDCGNANTVEVHFKLKNNFPATIEDLPTKTIQCGDPLIFDTPVVTNACGTTTVTFVDSVESGNCPAATTNIRTFTVTDGCGNASTAQQIILVEDLEAPVAPAAPADVTVSCADNIPQPVDLTASDNCLGAITVSPSAIITPGACDDQLVMVRTWIFTDGCNTSSVSQTITVNDDIAPVFTFVPANMTGECSMGGPIEFEDAVATDNCNGTVTITFVDDTVNNGVCGTTTTRTWTATDACGNASTASATMSTGDSEAPVASNVPSNTTIDCGATPVFGMPTFTDNCATDVTVVVTNATVDGDCDGEFVFTRTWTATDDCDNTTVISQSVTSQDTEGPVFVSVPSGTILCDGGNIDEPEVTDNCSSFTVTFVDDTNGTGCNQTITRTYTATDDCGNVTNATATLNIIDDEAPVFTNVPPTLDVNCDEVPEFTPPTAVDNCGDVELTFVETESGELCDEGFSRKRVWTATDNCGNTATVETSIWVNKDNTPPVFTFVPPTNIMINCEDFPPTFGQVEVEDDCSGVTITFEDDYVFGDEDSCDNGENFDYRRRWTATDGCGNESTAEQKFWVMAGPAAATISGALMTEEDEMTDNVMMTLENSNIGDQTQLSTDGNFTFPAFLNQNYTLTPERDDNPLNGITTYDLVLMGRHLLEIELLDSPYKLIAADVNNSGSVSALDMIRLRRLILHIDETFENNTSWRFVESQYVFPDATNPFASTFPEVSNFNGITQSQIADFMAIKIGDLNGSAVANQLAAGDTRSSDGDLVFQLDDADLAAGEQYEVEFKASDFAAVQGYQYTLNLSGLELVDVKAGALRGLTAENFGMTHLDRGILTTSWNAQTAVTVADDEVLFTLVVEARQAIKLSQALRVSSELTTAEGYSEASDKLAVSLRFGEEGTIGADAFTLYQNRPNPFGAETTISFSLPTAMDATLTIYDVSGRVLKQVTRNYAAGYNEELIERNELNITGVLYYQLETATETATKKMILVK